MKEYLVYIPITEYWVFKIEASSEAAAIKAGETGQDEMGNQVEQVWSEAAGKTAKARATEI